MRTTKGSGQVIETGDFREQTGELRKMIGNVNEGKVGDR